MWSWTDCLDEGCGKTLERTVRAIPHTCTIWDMHLLHRMCRYRRHWYTIQVTRCCPSPSFLRKLPHFHLRAERKHFRKICLSCHCDDTTHKYNDFFVKTDNFIIGYCHNKIIVLNNSDLFKAKFPYYFLETTDFHKKPAYKTISRQKTRELFPEIL